MCLYPKLITNPKYKATKKNKGQVPPLTDARVKWVPIGCQNCMECKKKKAREWNLRLQEDIKHNKDAKFITLTLSNWNYKVLRRYTQIHKIKTNDEYLIDNQIATIAIRRFLERWRKKYKKSLRHWAITELGHNGTENIHIHALVWTTNLEKIAPIWKYGHVWVGKQEKGRTIQYVNTKTINYITKYVTKVDFKHRGYKPIILTSPGIGRGYEKSYNGKIQIGNTSNQPTYKTTTGHKCSMPIYWRNKLFTEKEREQLWINILNKQERWIMGERISIKHGYEEYDKTLKFYQRKNIQLGYDSNEIKWEIKQYEQERRKLLNEKRMQKALKESEMNRGQESPSHFACAPPCEAACWQT